MGTVIEGKSKLVTVTPVIQAAAYADGDQLGSLFALVDALDDSSGTGGILSLSLVDKSKQKSALDILLFSGKPVVASADNAALDISDAEMAQKFIGKVHVSVSDYTDLANCSIACLTQVALLVNTVKDANNGNPSGRDIWCILMCRGTPTYVSTSDLVLKVGVIQD